MGETNTSVEFSENGNLESTHRSLSGSGVITVEELELNKRIIFRFNEIELFGTDNPSEIITLTEGKLNVNLETLNQ